MLVMDFRMSMWHDDTRFAVCVGHEEDAYSRRVIDYVSSVQLQVTSYKATTNIIVHRRSPRCLPARPIAVVDLLAHIA